MSTTGSVETVGTGSVGAYAFAGGIVNLTGSEVGTSGAETRTASMPMRAPSPPSTPVSQPPARAPSGLFLTGAARETPSASLTGSSLTSAAAPAISVLGSTANVTLAATSVTGNGCLARRFQQCRQSRRSQPHRQCLDAHRRCTHGGGEHFERHAAEWQRLDSDRRFRSYQSEQQRQPDSLFTTRRRRLQDVDGQGLYRCRRHGRP